MIKTLLSGWISDDDVNAVVKLGACIPDDERESVWDQVRGDVAGMNTYRQRQRVIRVLRPAGWVEPPTESRPSERTYGPYGVPKVGSAI